MKKICCFFLLLFGAVGILGMVDPKNSTSAVVRIQEQQQVAQKVEPNVVQSVNNINLNKVTAYRPQDLRYQGVKYNSGELDSCPKVMETTAHYFDSVDIHGESLNSTTGCGYSFRPRQDNGVASWFYPCGTELKITNRNNGRSVVVKVMDRGPNTKVYPDIKIDLYRRVFEVLGGQGGEIPVLVECLSGCGVQQVVQNTYHVVVKGENLLRISQKYGKSMDELAKVNRIIDYNKIFVGQKLSIPK